MDTKQEFPKGTKVLIDVPNVQYGTGVVVGYGRRTDLVRVKVQKKNSEEFYKELHTIYRGYLRRAE